MVENKIFLDDKVVPKLLKSEECREYLISIIAAVLNIDKEYIMDNLRLIDIEVNENIKNKDQEVDVIVENDEIIVNVEINTSNTKESRIKNHIYIAHLVIRQTKPGSPYRIKPVVQINVDAFDIYKKNEFIYHSVVMEKKHHIERKDTYFEIYDINLDFLSKMNYNQIKNLSDKDLKWLLYIFVCQDKKLNKILYSENKMMKKVRYKMDDFMKEFDQILVYDYRKFKEAELKEMREERMKKATEKGEKKKSIEIAKRLLSLKFMDVEQISEITSLTIKELEKLK